MRVLLVHNNYRVYGGAEVFVQEVARVLETHGHEVAFLASHEENSQSQWSAYFPRAPDYSRNRIAAVAQFPKLVYSMASKSSASKLVKEFKPDIVHCFAVYTKLTPSVLDAFRVAGVPVVCSLNDYKHICPNYKLFHHGKVCEDCRGRNFVHAIRNRCAHDSLLYSTASAMESYAHRFLNVYRKNIQLFLFASEFMAKKTEQFWGEDSFAWRLLRNPFDAPSHRVGDRYDPYAVYFGRLIEEKGVDTLVRAAALAHHIDVQIVGDGPATRALEDESRQLGLRNVTFHGEQWGPELDAIVGNCRFVVVPSLWHENFPYVIVQAFARGKAVIGTNRGGIPELVQNGERGLVYEAGDAVQLASLMNELISDESKAREFGASAKKFADVEFNDDRFYTNLMRIYSEAMM